MYTYKYIIDKRELLTNDDDIIVVNTKPYNWRFLSRMSWSEGYSADYCTVFKLPRNYLTYQQIYQFRTYQ